MAYSVKLKYREAKMGPNQNTINPTIHGSAKI
jgi:hypothetical protein